MGVLLGAEPAPGLIPTAVAALGASSPPSRAALSSSPVISPQESHPGAARGRNPLPAGRGAGPGAELRPGRSRGHAEFPERPGRHQEQGTRNWPGSSASHRAAGSVGEVFRGQENTVGSGQLKGTRCSLSPEPAGEAVQPPAAEWEDGGALGAVPCRHAELRRGHRAPENGLRGAEAEG